MRQTLRFLKIEAPQTSVGVATPAEPRGEKKVVFFADFGL